ncbi:MAG: DUF2931 family protein [Casimicrobium sp.]
MKSVCGRLQNLFSLLLLSICVPAMCVGVASAREKRYTWETDVATLSASPVVPLQIEWSRGDESIARMFIGGHLSTSLETGWGRHTIAERSRYDKNRPVPEALHLIWFSFEENKFYETKIELPHERIRALFEKGPEPLRDSGTYVNWYKTFTVGITAFGHGTVWLGDSVANKIELVHFTGTPVDVTADSHIHLYLRRTENNVLLREDYINSTLARVPENIRMKTRALADGKYLAELRKRYSYTPKPTIPPNSKLLHMGLEYANGEENRHMETTAMTLSSAERGVLRELALVWESKQATNYCDFKFDPVKLSRTLSEAQHNNPSAALILEVIAGNSKTAAIKLHRNKQIFSVAPLETKCEAVPKKNK